MTPTVGPTPLRPKNVEVSQTPPPPETPAAPPPGASKPPQTPKDGYETGTTKVENAQEAAPKALTPRDIGQQTARAIKAGDPSAANTLWRMLTSKDVKSRDELIAGLAEGGVQLKDVGVYLVTAGHRIEQNVSKTLSALAPANERTQLASDITKGVVQRRAQLKQTLPALPTDAVITGSLKAYAKAAEDYATGKIGLATFKETKARADADLAAYGANLGVLDSGSRELTQAVDRYTSLLSQRARAGAKAYAAANNETLPAMQEALNADIEALGGFRRSLPDESKAFKTLTKELGDLDDELTRIDAHKEFEPLAREPFAKQLHGDKQLAERIKLTNRYNDTNVDVRDLEHYVLTGETTPALQTTFDVAERTGEPTAGGVMLAARTARADYLKLKQADPSEISALTDQAQAWRNASKSLQLDKADRQKSRIERLLAKPEAQRTASEQRELASLQHDARYTYDVIDKEAREALSSGKHKPGSTVAKLASRATRGNTDLDWATKEPERPKEDAAYDRSKMAEGKRIDEAIKNGADEKTVLAMRKTKPPVYPAVLEHDQRTDAELAKGAMGPQPSGARSYEARYREAEFLDPSLNKDPSYRTQMRDLRRTQITTRNQHAQRKAEAAPEAVSVKWAQRQQELANDRAVAADASKAELKRGAAADSVAVMVADPLVIVPHVMRDFADKALQTRQNKLATVNDAAQDEIRFDVIRDSSDLKTRADSDLAAARAKPIAQRTADDERAIESIAGDREFATKNLQQRRNEIDRAYASRKGLDAQLHNAKQSLGDWEADFAAFQNRRVARMNADNAARDLKLALRGPVGNFVDGDLPEVPAYNEAENKELAQLQERRAVVDGDLAEAQRGRDNVYNDGPGLEATWRKATGADAVPTAKALWDDQAKVADSIGADLKSDAFKTNPHITKTDKAGLLHDHASARAQTAANEAESAKQDENHARIDREGDVALAEGHRRSFRHIYKGIEKIDDAAFQRAWDDAEKHGSAVVKYTKEEQKLHDDLKLKWQPHIDAKNTHEAAAAKGLVVVDAQQAIAVAKYADALKLAKEADEARVNFVSVERDAAIAGGRPVNQAEIDRRAALSVRTFATVSGAGASISPKLSREQLQMAVDLVTTELPPLTTGDDKTKLDRLSTRVGLHDMIGATASANMSVIASPPHRESSWQEGGDAYYDNMNISALVSGHALNDLDSKQKLQGGTLSQDDLELKAAATQRISDITNNPFVKDLLGVADAGMAAADLGHTNFQITADALEEAMVARIKAASGGLVGRVWTLASDWRNSPAGLLYGGVSGEGAGRDVIGGAIDVTREQYLTSKQGGDYTKKDYDSLMGLTRHVAAQDMRTRVRYGFYLHDPAHGSKGDAQRTLVAAGVKYFVDEKKLMDKPGFEQASWLWARRDPTRAAWAQGHRADDLHGLTKLYQQDGVADAMYAHNYESVYAKDALLGHNLKKIEDSFLIQLAYKGAKYYTMYRFARLGGNAISKIPGATTWMGAATKFVAARGVGVPMAQFLVGATEAYVTMKATTALQNRLASAFGVKPGDYGWDAIELFTSSLAFSGQLHVAGMTAKEARKEFVQGFGMLVGLGEGPVLIGKALGLNDKQIEHFSELAGIFVPAMIGAMGARKQVHVEAKALAKQTKIPEQYHDAVARVMGERKTSTFDKPATVESAKARRDHIYQRLRDEHVPHDEASRFADADLTQNSRSLVNPPKDLHELNERTDAFYEAWEKKLVESGVDPTTAKEFIKGEIIETVQAARLTMEADLAKAKAERAPIDETKPANVVRKLLTEERSYKIEKEQTQVYERARSNDEPPVKVRGSQHENLLPADAPPRLIGMPDGRHRAPATIEVGGKKITVDAFADAQVVRRVKAREGAPGVEETRLIAVGKAGDHFVVFDPATKQYSTVPAGDGGFKVDVQGNSALGIMREVGPRFDEVRTDLARRDPAASKALEATLGRARNVEEQAMLMRELASSGDPARVKELMDIYAKYKLTPDAVMRISTADGLYQLFGNACSVVSGQMMLAQSSPLEAINAFRYLKETVKQQHERLPEGAEIEARTDGKAPAFLDLPKLVEFADGADPRQVEAMLDSTLGPTTKKKYSVYHVSEDAVNVAAVTDTLIDVLPPNGPMREGVLVFVTLPGKDAKSTGGAHAMLATRTEVVNGETVVTFRDPFTGKVFERTSAQLKASGDRDFSLGGIAIHSDITPRFDAGVERGSPEYATFAAMHKERHGVHRDALRNIQRMSGPERAAVLKRLAGYPSDPHAKLLHDALSLGPDTARTAMDILANSPDPVAEWKKSAERMPADFPRSDFTHYAKHELKRLWKQSPTNHELLQTLAKLSENPATRGIAVEIITSLRHIAEPRLFSDINETLKVKPMAGLILARQSVPQAVKVKGASGAEPIYAKLARLEPASHREAFMEIARNERDPERLALFELAIDRGPYSAHMAALLLASSPNVPVHALDPVLTRFVLEVGEAPFVPVSHMVGKDYVELAAQAYYVQLEAKGDWTPTRSAKWREVEAFAAGRSHVGLPRSAWDPQVQRAPQSAADVAVPGHRLDARSREGALYDRMAFNEPAKRPALRAIAAIDDPHVRAQLINALAAQSAPELIQLLGNAIARGPKTALTAALLLEATGAKSIAQLDPFAVRFVASVTEDFFVNMPQTQLTGTAWLELAAQMHHVLTDAAANGFTPDHVSKLGLLNDLATYDPTTAHRILGAIRGETHADRTSWMRAQLKVSPQHALASAGKLVASKDLPPTPAPAAHSVPPGIKQLQPAEVQRIMAQAVIQPRTPPHVTRPVPAPTVEFYRAMGLEPKTTIEVGGKKIHMSDPYDLGEGRAGVVAYIEEGGRTYVRSFYRSNSRGVWQSASHHGSLMRHNGDLVMFDGHYGKGHGNGKYSTVLPIELQAHLHTIAPAGGKQLQPLPAHLQGHKMGFRDPITRKIVAHETDVGASEVAFFGPLDYETKDSFHTATGDANYERPLLHNPQGVGSELSVLQPAQEPDFSVTARTFKVSLDRTVYPNDVTAYVVPSKNKEINYMFYSDGSRVWLAQVDVVNAKVSSFGAKTEMFDPGNLAVARAEYHVMMPRGYRGEMINGSYGEVKATFHDSIPMLRDAKAAFGIGGGSQ